jgi:hypothetical protein
MALNVGCTICVLRNVLQKDQKITAWFAPLRGQRFLGSRTSFGAKVVDHSYPSKDIRVDLHTSDPLCDDLLIANVLAKIERSPIFVIDCGLDGTEAVILTPDFPAMVAGSMGFVIPVPIRRDQVGALRNLIGGSGETICGILKLAAGIFERCPQEIRSLLPLTQGDRSKSVLDIAAALIKASPFITGIFPSSFSKSTDPRIQNLASIGGFSGIKLREIDVDDLMDEDLVRLLKTLMVILMDRRYPIWIFYLLEDVHTPLVQELIRYLPIMVHLRASPIYGSYASNRHSALIPTEGDISEIPAQDIIAFEAQRIMILSDLSWYLSPRSLSWSERLIIRSLWYPGSSEDSEIVRRPDLTPIKPEMSPGIWAEPLGGFIKRMSHIHDPGSFPQNIVITHLMEQVFDQVTGEFAAGSRGVAEPIFYRSYQRNVA